MNRNFPAAPASVSRRHAFHRVTAIALILVLAAADPGTLTAQPTYTNSQTSNTPQTTSAGAPLTLTIASGNATESGVISGAGNVTKAGAGMLTLSGANTYTGTTFISAGTLNFQGASSLATTNLTLNGGVFAQQGTFDLDLGTAASQAQFGSSGGGFAAVGGALTVNLGGAGGTIAWGTDIPNGAPLILSSANADAVVTWTNPVSFGTANRTITVNENTLSATDYAIVSGAISGTGSAGLLKSGSGSLVLTGTLSYPGTTEISGGLLAFSGAASLPGSNLVLSGGVLGASGSFERALGTGAGQVQVRSGGFAASGGALTVALSGVATPSNPGGALPVWGLNNFLTGGSALTLSSNFADNVVTWTNNFSLGTTPSATQRIINVDDNLLSSGDWAVISGTISGASGLGITKNGNGTLLLTGTNTFDGPIVISSGTLSLSSINSINGATGSALGQPTSATNATITVGGTLLYTGAGDSTDRPIKFGAVSGSSGALDASGTGPLVFSGAFTAAFAGRNLTLTGISTADNEVRGIISDLSGSSGVLKTGVGTWLLSGANTYTGATTVNAGVLKLAETGKLGSGALLILTNTPGGTATLDIGNSTNTVSSLSLGGTTGTTATSQAVLVGAGTLGLAGNITFQATGNPLGAAISAHLDLGAASRTFVINDSTTAPIDLTVSGVISGSAGSGLTKASPGTLLLSGNNTYTGLTTVSGGILSIDHINGLGSTAAGTVVSSGGTLNLNNLALGAEAVSIAGTGVSGVGALTGTGNASLSGNLTLANSTATVGVPNTADILTLSGIIDGASGSLTKVGNGTLVLSGANSYAGNTIVNGGTLLLAPTGTLSSAALTVANFVGGTTILDIGNATITATSLTFGGTGSSATSRSDLIGVGGTLNLGGNVTYLATGNPLGAQITAHVELGATNRTFAINDSSNTLAELTVSGTLSGAAGIGFSKISSGTLQLIGNNTYSGTTTVSGGTLSIGHENGLGSTTAGTTVSPGATLNLSNVAIGAEAVTLNGTGVSGVGALTGTGNASLAGSITLVGSVATSIGVPNSADTLTLSGPISGNPVTLTKVGSGTLVLTGANTYVGGTFVTGGTLKLMPGVAFGNTSFGIYSTLAGGTTTLDIGNVSVAAGSLFLGNSSSTATSQANIIGSTGVITVGGGQASGGNITFSSAGNPLGSLISANIALGPSLATRAIIANDSSNAPIDLTISGVISGSAALIKAGDGTLLLSGNNTYTNTTTITGGTLQLGPSGKLGNSSVTVFSTLAGGTTTLDIGDAATTIGALILGNSSSTSTSQTKIVGTSGILTLGGSVQYNATGHPLGSQISANLNIGSGARFFDVGDSANAPVDLTVSGAIGGSGGAPTKIGAGVLLFSGNNTYTGVTTVSTGILSVGHANALGAITAGTIVANGATLHLDNIGLGAESVSLDGSGSASVGALIGTGTSSLSGNVTLAGAGSAIGVPGAGDTLTLSGAISGNSSLAKYGAGILVLSGSNTYTGNTHLTEGTLAISASANLGNATNPLGFSGGTLRITGTTVNNFGAHPLYPNSAVSLDIADVANTFTISEVLQGSTYVQKTGNGTLVLNNGGNTYSGGTFLYGGTLSISDDAQLGAGAFSFFAGTLLTSTGITSSRNFSLNTGDTSFTIPAGQTTTLNGAVSGSALVKAGAGTLVLGNPANNYFGTTLSAGTLSVSANGQLGLGALTFAGGTLLTSTGFTSTTPLALTGVRDTISVPAGNTTVANGLITGAGSLAKTGGGILILGSAANSYSGGTVIAAGTLGIDSDAFLGQSSGILTIDGGALSTSSGFSSGRAVTLGAGNGTVDVPGNRTLTLSGSIDGTGTLIKANEGTLTLGGAGNSYSGGTSVTGGTLSVTNDAQLGASSGALALNGGGLLSPTVNFASARSVTLDTSGGVGVPDGVVVTLSGPIAGTGELIKHGTGTLTLSGPTTYSGATNIYSGTLSLTGTGGLGSAAVGTTIAPLAALNLNQVAVGAEPITLSGSGPAGDGALTGTGTSSLSGNIALAANVTFGTALAADTLTLSGAIADSGGSRSLTKVGTGTLILSGDNTYSGSTTVSAGILQFTRPSSLYSGVTGNWTATNLVVASGATLAVNAGGTGFTAGNIDTLRANAGFASGASLGVDTTNGDFTYGSIIGDSTAGPLGLVKLGANKLTLSGASTYTGGTVVNSGTLALGASNVLANTGAITIAGGVLSLGSFSDTVGAIALTSGSITGSGALTGSSYTVVSGSIFPILAGAGALVKSGSGTVTLSGANTFTGGTTLMEGTLNVTGNLVGKNGVTGASGVAGTAGTLTLQSNAGTTLQIGASSSAATGHLTGGAGGAGFTATVSGGTIASNGGAGAAAATLGAGNALANAGLITGGAGGNGGGRSGALSGIVSSAGGGDGGVAISLEAAGSLTNAATGTISGGSGGNSGNASNTGSGSTFRSSSGDSGAGGAAIVFPSTGSVTNLGNITGGAAGTAGSSGSFGSATGGLGGAGGAAISFGGAGVVVNSNRIAGGAGGTGGNAGAQNAVDIHSGNGGPGGVGIAFGSGSTLTNDTGGKVIGGAGGVRFDAASVGAGGTAVTGANLAILNRGEITGGLAGDNTTRANAIVFTGTGNSLELQAGSLITGTVAGSTTGTDTLILGGTSDATLAGAIGPGGQYRDFDAFTKNGTATWSLTADNVSPGNATISAGTLQVGNGGTTGSFAGAIANNATLVFNRGDNFSHTSAISGTGAVTKDGAGRLTLDGSLTYTGTTSVRAGELRLNSTASASDFTVNFGATLSGSGTTGPLTLASGAFLSPGNSPGTLSSVGLTTLNGGSTINWELNRATGGIAGTNWDLLSVTGALALNASSGNRINVVLSTLDFTTGLPGAASNIAPATSYTFAFASSTTSLTGFTGSDQFSLNTAGLSGFGPGTWSIAQIGNTLDLVFTAGAIPEPGTYAALAGLLALGSAVWRRRRPRPTPANRP